MLDPPSPRLIAELRAGLLAWYRANARDLPWRRTRDPYAIWISEVMLQQTRVDTVRPYFERFLTRWPSVRALAAADPDDVRAAWSGLGYYRRARAMLDAAEAIVDRFDGRLPDDPAQLATLPGFGPYTTGAVASIAFDRPVPAVDGNVARVLARVFLIEGDVTAGAPARRVREIAATLAPGEAPGELNQALIELGALLCKRSPSCGGCPARRSCLARRLGRTTDVPPPRKRREPKTVDLTVLVLHDDRGVVLQSRPEGGLFGGMACPPWIDGALNAEQTRAAALEQGLELRSIGLDSAGTVEHLLTHRHIRARVFVGRAPRRLDTPFWRVPSSDLMNVGLPTFATKILRAALPADQLGAGLPGRSQPKRARQVNLPFMDRKKLGT